MKLGVPPQLSFTTVGGLVRQRVNDHQLLFLSSCLIPFINTLNARIQPALLKDSLTEERLKTEAQIAAKHSLKHYAKVVAQHTLCVALGAGLFVTGDETARQMVYHWETQVGIFAYYVKKICLTIIPSLPPRSLRLLIGPDPRPVDLAYYQGVRCPFHAGRDAAYRLAITTAASVAVEVAFAAGEAPAGKRREAARNACRRVVFVYAVRNACVVAASFVATAMLPQSAIVAEMVAMSLAGTYAVKLWGGPSCH